MIRKEAWPFYRTISGVRLSWELEEPEGPKKDLCWEHSNPKGPKGSIEDHPLDARREPSALEGWILEVLYRDPKESRACMRILSTEGRGVRLCWALSKPEGPKGAHGGVRPFHQKSTCLTQLTLGPYVVQNWSSYGRKFDPTKPSYSTVRGFRSKDLKKGLFCGCILREDFQKE